MATSIDSSTRFTSMGLGYEIIRRHITSIGWKTDATPAVSGRIRFTDAGVASSVDYEDDLAVLQEIYASTDGFQDADGNSITVGLYSFPDSTDIAELEPNGVVNPLVDSYEDRLENKRKMRGYEAQDLVKAKTVGGREQIEHTVDLVTKDGKPIGTNYDYPMRRWLVYQETDTQIRLVLLIPEHQAPLVAELANYSPIVAFLAWLESIRQSGDVVGSDLSNVASRLTALGNRDYDIPLVNSNTLRVRYSTTGFVLATSKYIEVSFRMTRQSGTIDVDDLRDYLQATTVSVPSDKVVVNSEVGDYNSIHKFQRQDIDENRSIEYLHDSILKHGKVQRSGRLYTLPIGPDWGIGLQYSELALINSKRVIPFVDGMNAVHFQGQSADGVIKIDTPRVLVRYRGTDRIITIHNLDSTYNVEVQDWDDNTLIILRPSEHFSFRMSLDQDGQNGYLIDFDVPERLYELAITHRNPFAAQVNFGDTPWWTRATNITGQRFHQIPYANGDITTRDADAYEIFSAARPSAGYQNQIMEDEVTLEFDGVVKMLHPGRLTAEVVLEMLIDTDESGGIQGNHGVNLIRFPDPVATHTSFIENNYTNLTGAESEWEYVINITRQLAKGDLLIPVLRYQASEVTVSELGNLLVRSVRLNYRYKPDIFIEWAA